MSAFHDVERVNRTLLRAAVQAGIGIMLIVGALLWVAAWNLLDATRAAESRDVVERVEP